MAPRPLELDVDGRTVTFTDPAMARAAGRRWSRMARDLDSADATPAVREKVRELRARAKSAQDWARRSEDAEPAGTQPPPALSSVPPPAGKPSPSRRRAAAALTQTGIRRGRRAARTTRRTSSRAARRYEAAGGVFEPSSLGEFAIFFFGSLVALVLLQDVLSTRGASSFASATKVAGGIAHRVISPVPIVNAQGG